MLLHILRQLFNVVRLKLLPVLAGPKPFMQADMHDPLVVVAELMALIIYDELVVA